MFGILPLIPFFIAKSYDLTVDKYIIFPSIGVAIGGLILLGILKSCVTIQSWYTSVLETLIVGGLSAGTSYGVGKAFE